MCKKCGCNTCETITGPLLTESKVKSLLSEGLQYHINNKIPLFETIYRIGSDSYLSLIKEAVKLKFDKSVFISSCLTSNVRKVAKLAKLNANQVIDNRINQSDRYSYAIKDLSSYLGLNSNKLTIEGFDVSHHAGKFAVASAVRFADQGPDKSMYRLFYIPPSLSGNDIGSICNVLERRIQSAKKKSIA